LYAINPADAVRVADDPHNVTGLAGEIESGGGGTDVNVSGVEAPEQPLASFPVTEMVIGLLIEITAVPDCPFDQTKLV
jgi:hypothetical protein